MKRLQRFQALFLFFTVKLPSGRAGYGRSDPQRGVFRGTGLRTALRRGFYEKGYRLKSTLSCFWQVDGSPVPVIQFPTE